MQNFSFGGNAPLPPAVTCLLFTILNKGCNRASCSFFVMMQSLYLFVHEVRAENQTFLAPFCSNSVNYLNPLTLHETCI